MEFSTSQTKTNLMRAFAGESQARNRYIFASQQALSMKLYVISDVFKFTAKQEEAHAKVFYEHLQELSGENIEINGSYPIDLDDHVLGLLRAAVHNELEEAEDVYLEFSEVARNEGFPKIAADFENIAKIEAMHAKRFEEYADLLDEQMLFRSEEKTQWMCLHCGHIHEGVMAPKTCPVCSYEQGHFLRVGEQ